MKRIVVGLLAVCLLGSMTVLANEENATADKAAKTEKAVKKDVALQDITATGKLAKTATGFTVTEADGTVVQVKAPKAAKEGEAAAAVDCEKIEKLVGKDVKVAGKGVVKTKGEKKSSHIKVVSSIEEVAAVAK